MSTRLKCIPPRHVPLVWAHAGEDKTVWNYVLNLIISSFARVGALITPFIAQVISAQSKQLAASVYGIVTLIATIACAMLPIETKGRDMSETSAPKRKKKKKAKAAPVREFDNPIQFDGGGASSSSS